METSQELQHWGIKGQKWGIRRYQNPDGTLTEAGKKRYRYQNPDGSLTEEGKRDYMNAARKGKLDVHTLSDADLNMINLRFAREKTFKQNIKEYEDSLFSTKLKNAVISRISGNGNSGGGKKKGSGLVAKLFAEPVKKAFEDALKSNNEGNDNSNSKGKGKGNENKSDDSKDKDNKSNNTPKNASNSNSSISRLAGWSMSKNLDDLERDGYVGAGKKAAPKLFSRMDEIERNGYSGVHKTWSNMNSSRLDDIEREGWTRHSGIYVFTRSDDDYLAHHGIIGQKWGVRRYQNPDGTLTEAGKARIAQTAGYGYLNPTYKDIKKGKAKNRYSVSKEYDDKFWKNVSNGMRTDEPTKEGKKLWDGFKDQYASATLKDLKMKITPQAIREVKRLLAQIDPSYSYSHKVKDDNGDYEDRRDERFKQRRQMIEHPIKTKASKAANKTIDTAAKLAPIIKTLA